MTTQQNYREEILNVRKQIDELLTLNNETNRMPYEKFAARLDSGDVGEDLETYRMNIRSLNRYRDQFGLEPAVIAGFDIEWR